MEAQQCVKLTGTNSSIGLIVLINQCSQRRCRCGFLCLTGRTGIAMTALKPPLWPSLTLRRGGARAPGSSRRSFVLPHGSHRDRHDAAKAAAMAIPDPPAGRRTRAGVLAALVRAQPPTPPIRTRTKITKNVFFADLVALARGSGPDPIPNSTVKSLRADGTKSQDLGE